MTVVRITTFLFAIALFAACGSETPSKDSSAVTETTEAISQQAADLTARSEVALAEAKTKEVTNPTPPDELKATLQSSDPVVPAKGKSSNQAKPVAVKNTQKEVNKSVNSTKPQAVETKPVPPKTAPTKTETPVVQTPNPPTNNTTTTTVKVETEAPKPQVEKPVDTKVDHAPFDALLKKHVSSTGKVNYKGFKSDKAKLEAYFEALSTKPIQSDWSRSEKMAYWINAYNAFTVKLIVDNYPVKSITDLEGGKPWDKKWIKLGGKTYSLNQIENEILRPQFKEAAIHFAVNCAANSCPPLLNRAWTAANLKTNFKKQASAFINNPKYNKISADKIQVSKIFDWYKEDFGNLIDYLNIYSSTQINSGAKIEYMEYDWGLNE